MKPTKKKNATKKPFWQLGQKYFIRSVTHYYTGRLIQIDGPELVFDHAAWIADTGRFHDALKNGTLNEVEPFPHPVMINRTAIIDATIWHKDLIEVQK